MRSARKALARVSGLASLAGLVSLVGLACGSRTGLYVEAADENEPDASLPDATDVHDSTDGLDVLDARDTRNTPDTLDTAPVGCHPGVIALVRATPTVMWVIDRSGSMNDAMTTTTGRSTRWQVLSRALSATLPAVDATMQTGALFFPAVGAGTFSCGLPPSVDLVPALGNAAPLIAHFTSTRPAGATPTATALDEAGKELLTVRAASTARTMVLATDGAPGCNSALDPRSCRCVSPTTGCRGRPELCLDDTRTVDTIATYAKIGVPTFVIGIHAETETTFDDVLDAMAVAGDRAKTTGLHKYYAATSEAELDTALVAIRDQVGACTYLTTSVPDAAGSLVVTIGGTVVPRDDTGKDGWSWADEANGQIVLFGGSCEAAKVATAVNAIVQCAED